MSVCVEITGEALSPYTGMLGIVVAIASPIRLHSYNKFRIPLRCITDESMRNRSITILDMAYSIYLLRVLLYVFRAYPTWLMPNFFMSLFTDNYPYERNLIKQAMDLIERDSCVRFMARVSEQYYLRFIRGNGYKIVITDIRK